jgi:hypothetical protein
MELGVTQALSLLVRILGVGAGVVVALVVAYFVVRNRGRMRGA